MQKKATCRYRRTLFSAFLLLTVLAPASAVVPGPDSAASIDNRLRVLNVSPVLAASSYASTSGLVSSGRHGLRDDSDSRERAGALS